MIDEKTLAEGEKNLLETVSRYPDAKRLLMGEVEIIRLARRYLALRGHIANVRHFDLLLDDDDGSTIDAAADRLLENES